MRSRDAAASMKRPAGDRGSELAGERRRAKSSMRQSGNFGLEVMLPVVTRLREKERAFACRLDSRRRSTRRGANQPNRKRTGRHVRCRRVEIRTSDIAEWETTAAIRRDVLDRRELEPEKDAKISTRT